MDRGGKKPGNYRKLYKIFINVIPHQYVMLKINEIQMDEEEEYLLAPEFYI